MKLIITGSTGYVGKEVVRQSLLRKDITSVVALSRQATPAPSGTDAAKYKNIVVPDYGTYTESVKKELTGANACIWTVAMTPGKAMAYSFDEVRRVCQEWAVTGLQAMYESGPATPFRFLYMSGNGAERDQSKPPMVGGQYLCMRGEAENRIVAFAQQHEGEVEVAAARPGLINHRNTTLGSVRSAAVRWTMLIPAIDMDELVAAMLDQVVSGFEKDLLSNKDLNRIGQSARKKTESRVENPPTTA